MKGLTLRSKIRRLLQGSSRGLTLVELVIAMALMGIIVVALLGGLSNAIVALHFADVQATAESLARSEMEHAKSLPYDEDGYASAITEDYVDAGYSSVIDAQLVDEDDPALQEITVTVTHHGEVVVALVGYRADR